MLILLVLLGCGKGAGNGLYPVYPWPKRPQAITEPGKVWLSCGDDYICLTPEQVEDLRVFVIEQDAVIEKYFNLITKHNESVN